ncbi:hypothetical protein JOF29_001006 [Kribbella aluminosa]|uniref:DUF4429 domain-containing protein n=1 Tax=Kribbella aluminosa TaxID=416017 RepID=A0ABS4UE84_9ACTN|nr:DUF4429 domain-containing protein [Kribbella aluminosa]MBP2349923.1 hypothetical protein [Kribbella aluminosa]
MAGGELTSTYGTVVWDGVGTLRIRYDGTRPGLDPLAGSLRTRLGERVLPVEALQSVEVVGNGLRLVLRDGADPLQAVSGVDVLGDLYDFPDVDRAVAEQVRREIRRTLARRDVPAAAARWLLAPPAAPDRLEGRDATLSVASGQLTFAYHRGAGRRKRALGNPWSVPLDTILDVEWRPDRGGIGGRGYLRIRTGRTPLERPKPKHDPAAMVTRRGSDVDALFFAARLFTRIRP